MWLQYIVAQQQKTGWLGPDNHDSGMIYWPRWPILFTFVNFYEYTGDTTYINASIAWLHAAANRLPNEPMYYDWTGVRYQDWVLAIQYLIDCDATPASEIPFLINFITIIYSKGKEIQNWEETWFVDPANGGWFPTEAVPGDKCNLTNHGVNQGQAVKSAAVFYRSQLRPDLDLKFSSYERLRLLDTYHGTPTGVFMADEHLAGNMPSHGTETCTVVELMFSWNTVHEIFGDAYFADRAELIAYNALPGSMTKDLTARVYLQQPNEPISVVQDNHVWISDGPDSIIYSLQGNYACCTANFNQGWPKFIQKMLHITPDNGIAVSLLGPVTATYPNGVTVSVSGDYPFEDDVTITVVNPNASITSPVPLQVRIPAWATTATLSINGNTPFSVGEWAGTMYSVPLGNSVSASGYTVTLYTNPVIRVQTGWYNNSVAVHRGALVYAAHLGELLTVTHNWYENFNDYNITMTSNSTPWNIALVLDPSAPDQYLQFQRVGPVPVVPYSSTETSVIITGKAVVLNNWGFAPDGSAQPPPASPIDCSVSGACGTPIDIVLVPYGTTHLRVTEIPYTMNAN